MPIEQALIKEWLQKNLDWKLLNSLVYVALEEIHTLSYYDIFFGRKKDEMNVTFWNINRAAFFDTEPLFIDYDQNKKCYSFFIGLFGLAELSFTGGSGSIYIEDVEFCTFYTLNVKNRNMIQYQTKFFEEEICFFESESTSDI